MTTPLERSLRRITSSLDEVGQPYALVGGLAVSVRAEPRLTRDADLAVAVDDDAHPKRSSGASPQWAIGQAL